MPVELNEFLKRYAVELEILASLAADLDHHLGEAVSASRSGNKGKEMHELRLEAQGVDLLRQSLEQLHSILLKVASQLPVGQHIDLSPFVSSINLRDLADRLGNGRYVRQSDTAISDPATPKGSLHLF